MMVNKYFAYGTLRQLQNKKTLDCMNVTLDYRQIPVMLKKT